MIYVLKSAIKIKSKLILLPLINCICKNIYQLLSVVCGDWRLTKSQK